MDAANELQRELADLESVEEILAHFCIDYDARVVHASRLHILKRFHDYLAHAGAYDADSAHVCLARAYDDFVRSDALTERVFEVHKRSAGIATVALSAIGGRRTP